MDKTRRRDPGAEGRQAQLQVKRRRQQQQHRSQHDAECGQTCAARQRLKGNDGFQRFAQMIALGEAQHDIGQADRRDGGQGELPQPGHQWWHVAAENHQVGRVGDGQYKACCVSDEGADEQVGQRLCLGRFGRGVNGRGQYHGGGVVREKYRHQRADQEHQVEQSLPRTPGMLRCIHGQPVEEPLLTREFSQHHHANQKQINIAALGHRRQCRVERNKPQTCE